MARLLIGFTSWNRQRVPELTGRLLKAIRLVLSYHKDCIAKGKNTVFFTRRYMIPSTDREAMGPVLSL